jgi:predicted 3-demethylubiquinone-9 3-methyltransferase (glyoxalase superfamily)
MKPRIKTFLMFEGMAEDAMNFYLSLFEDAKIVSIIRYGPGEAGVEGTVMKAVFELAGQEFMCIDSPVKHAFTFTPSISLFVDFENDAQISETFAKLSEDGQILMPLGEYPFSPKYGWVADKFGVSWQLNLLHAAPGAD